MHIVDQITILGFRARSEPLVLNLNQGVNFIIGRNGTGKTSLINLINAALSGDGRQLLSSLFQEVRIKLRAKGSSARPVVTIRKETDDDNDLEIAYYIQRKSSEKARRFTLDSVEYLRRGLLASHSKRFYLNALRQSQMDISEVSEVKSELNELVSTSWLSVHRVNWREAEPEAKRFQSPVDQKLEEVSTKFGTYFSTLDKRSASETDRFQTAYFLSLISPPKIAAMSEDLEHISAAAERDALQAMFSEFKLKQSAYGSKLDNFFKRAEKAKGEYSRSSPVPADVFLTLTDTLRIHELVAEWNSLLEKREEIYAPKNDFIRIINSLFFKKTMEISPGNQTQFFDENHDEISSDNLSSGEKQMLIILGETLLQRGRRCVFMADEPELSLHIDWQLKLVPSLRDINPNAQIIFATHSPDIVGAYGKNAIDLEKLV